MNSPGLFALINKGKRNFFLELPPFFRITLENVLAALAYWGLGLLLMRFFAKHGLFPSPIWPSAAIALVVSLFRGGLVGPGIFSGSLLINHLSMGASLPLALSISCFNTLGPWLGAAMIVRVLGGAVRFGHLRDVAVFSVFGVLLHSLITGLGGAISMWLLGDAPLERFIGTGLLWWLSDASGALLFAPVLLHWLMPWSSAGVSRRRGLEALLAAACSLALTWLTFWYLPNDEGVNLGMPWLILLPLLWISGRMPAVFSQTILLGIALIAIVGAVSHRGVFFVSENSPAVRATGMMILGLSFTVLVVHALLAERRQSEQLLETINAQLERKVDERTLALSRSEEKYRTIFESAGVGIAVVGADVRYRASNQRWSEMCGYSEEELWRMSPLELVTEEFRNACAELAKRLLAGEMKQYKTESTFHTREGGLIWVDVSVVPLYDSQGRVESLLTVMADVTERHRSRELLRRQLKEIQALEVSLREQAIRDGLTGLYNRRYLDETLERECFRAGREGRPLSLIIADVDHFKGFNDRYGHQAGDRMLQAFGEMLGNDIRHGDIACRYGGEEFVVILPHAPLSAARERAERLRAEFAALQIPFGGKILSSTLSLGLAAFPEHAGDAESLLHAADQALYAAKTRGRNRVESFHPG